MRIALLAVVFVGCDAGPLPEPPRPAPVPAPAIDAGVAAPTMPHAIEYKLGGLGVWKDVVTGIMWRVEIDLPGASITVTDPGGVTKRRALTPDQVRDYTQLATAVRGQPIPKPTYGCTDRSETLRIDTLVLEDSCPIAQPAAHALITTIEPELK
jgi:hypothetical protein